jgi:predicted AlkP superfamily phosphohydrolase/phosphomutase
MLKFLRRKKARKVFVVGLDCMEPSLVFERWQDQLPNLKRLMDRGAFGRLTSSTPCITVPAWSSMLSSTDPGVLGIYGFRNRSDYSYSNMFIATSHAVKQKRLWEYLGEAGKRVIVVGVPQTYPVQAVNGYLISSFLTPTVQKQYTHPHELRHEIDRILEGQEYDVDVRQYRTEDKDFLLRQIFEMTEKRFKVLHYLQQTKPWDFFMFVEMGVDRIHHGFWKFSDPEHRLYEPGNKYENAILDYYKYIDRELGHMLDRLDQDTVVLILSDHGAKKMDGGFCLNEWLVREGYLVFKDEVPRNGTFTPFEKLEVDWAKTKAWGAGGYYGRLFLNVAGREPQGTISRSEYEAVRAEIRQKLEAMPDHEGKPMGNVCFQAEEIYREVNNVAPDLLLYFGNLNWRSVGTMGHPDIYTFENDTGPDDANHAQDGLIIYFDPRHQLGGRPITGAQLMDVAPTILNIMEQPIPKHMQGKVIDL